MNSRDSLKVIHISEDARGGGQFQYMIDIVSDSDLNYQIICPDLSESLVEKCNSIHHKFQYIKLRVLNVKSAFSFILFFIPEVFSLIRKLRKQKPDVVVCHSSIQVKGIIASRLVGIPCVWIMHDSFISGLSQFIFMLFNRFCKHYIFVSSRSQQFYNQHFKSLHNKKQSVIPSAVDHLRYNKGSSEKLPSNLFNIVTTCYINKWKGLELFIDIASLMKEYNKDLQFHIIGPILKSRREYANTLLDKISVLNLKNITLHGYRSDIPEYLKSASLYLCTSTHESSPISVWEAMATGLPILSSDVGDIGSYVEDTESGIVIKNRIASHYCEAILKIKEDDQLRKKYSQNAHETTLAQFSKTSFQARHRNFYQNAANSSI